MKVRFDFDYYMVTEVDEHGLSYITWGDGVKGAVYLVDFPNLRQRLEHTIEYPISSYLKALKCYLQEE